MLGSRGIYHDGWKAVTFKPLGHMYDDGLDPDAPFDDDVWELYHVAEDLSECDDLAATHPEKLRELIDLWWREAAAYHVLPLDNRPARGTAQSPPAARADHVTGYTYYAHGALVPEDVAVNVRNRAHTITAFVDIPAGLGPQGVLLAVGSVLGGFSLYVLDGCLHYVHNLAGIEQHRITSTRRISAGPARARVPMRGDRADYAGIGRLLVDGDRGRRRAARAPHTGSVLDHRRRTHLRLRARARGVVRLRSAVPVQRDAASRDVDVRGNADVDPESEFDAIMSEQ